MVDPRLFLVALLVALASAAVFYAIHGHGGAAQPVEPAAGAGEAGGCGGGGGGGVCVPGSLYLVILGTEGCPHCRAMKEYLPGIVNDTYFCEIMRQGSTCAEAFMELVTAGVTKGVPTIVACSRLTGQVVFVEVGEYRNTTWWRRILANPPSEPTVYMEGRPVTTLDPVTAQKVSRLVCREAIEKGDAEPARG